MNFEKFKKKKSFFPRWKIFFRNRKGVCFLFSHTVLKFISCFCLFYHVKKNFQKKFFSLHEKIFSFCKIQKIFIFKNIFLWSFFSIFSPSLQLFLSWILWIFLSFCFFFFKIFWMFAFSRNFEKYFCSWLLKITHIFLFEDMKNIFVFFIF